MSQTAWPLRDRTAIVGIGYGTFGRRTGLTGMEQNQIAFHNALEDAGLKPSDVDGLLVHTGPTQCDQLPEYLGINVRWSGEVWFHGRMAAVALQWAAMVVNAGMANYVAITSARVNKKQLTGERSETSEDYRPGGGPHAEYPPYGMIHPGCLAAMTFGQYVDRHGGERDHLDYIAVNQRKSAIRNPIAYYREPLTIEDYVASRYVIEPLRLYDFCYNVDGGVCLIVTTAERARHGKSTPVLLSGMQGLASGKEFVTLGLTGLGSVRQDAFPYSVDACPEYTRTAYDMAGVSRDDVRAYTMYDSFSPMVLYGIEEWGLCPPGEGLAWLKETDTSFEGSVPINTGGGHLSSGATSGMALVAEAIQQARGDCGERQVRDCYVSQYVHTAFLTCIFKRDVR